MLSMKKTLFTLFTLITCIALLPAEEVFDFTYSLPAGWSATVAPSRFEGGDDGRGAQFAASSELTLPKSMGIKEVTVFCSTNSSEDNENSIAVMVGEQSFGLKQLPKANGQTLTFTYSEAVDGDLNIINTKTQKKSVWIKTVTIDGTFDKSILPKEDPYEGLMDDYVYAEPDTVVSREALGSKIPYTFVYHNIKVIATQGTKTEYYFGANANSKLTFVTTRKMKAIVVDGLVNKNFSASSTSGKIAYKSSSAIDIEEEQVLAVTDIDSTILTLYCDAQLRCNEVRVYFEANPEIEINQDGPDEYSYEWEPAEATTLAITFDNLEANDMTESLGYACTNLSLSNENYELLLSVFVSTVDAPTILPVGTYPINDSYALNTVMASPGGYEDFDFPSYLITDFEYDQTSGSMFYSTIYYLAGGMLDVNAIEGGVLLVLNATTHFGSTINAVYSQSNSNAVENITTGTRVTKFIRDGKFLLRRGEATYSVIGIKL